MPEHQT